MCARMLFVIAVLVWPLSPASGQEGGVGDVIVRFPNTGWLELQLEESLERELNVLRQLTGLDADQLPPLMQAVRPAVKLEAARLLVLEKSSKRRPFGRPLTPTIRQALLQAAKPVVNDDAVLDRYQNDTAERERFEFEANVRGFMAVLDQALRLTPDQEPHIREVVTRLNRKQELPDVMSLSDSGALGVPAAALKPNLRPAQHAFLLSREEAKQNRLAIGAEEDESALRSWRSHLMQVLRNVADTHIDSLRVELKLAPGQVQRLQLAAKGVFAEITDRRLEAIRAFRRREGGVPPDTETSTWATADPITLFASHARWLRFLEATLSPEQLAVFRQSEARRSARLREVLGYMFVRGFGEELSLTAVHQQAFRRLIVDTLPKVKVMHEASSLHVYDALFSIPDAKFRDAIGEANWSKLGPQIQAARTQIREVEEANSGLRSEPSAAGDAP